jgi:Fibronectin type III domain
MTTQCPGNYLVLPPREWFRFENRCATSIVDPFLNGKKKNYVPFVNLIVNPDDYLYQQAVLQKGNVLQYKKNSSNLTKKQRYAQIAKGMWINRSKTYASQTESVTIPNTNSLKRVNASSFNVTTGQTTTTQGVSCPPLPSPPTFNSLPNTHTGTNPNQPVIPPPIPNPKDTAPIVPVIVTPIQPEDLIIADGGNLLCNISENPCTGEIYKVTHNIDCYPNTDSDVPGPFTLLCWDDAYPTNYPRTKLTYGTSDNKWPTNSKFITSALNSPTAPTNLSITSKNNGSFYLSWGVPVYNGGVNISSYSIVINSSDGSYRNSISVSDTNASVDGLQKNMKYTFTVAGVNSIGTGENASISYNYE